MAELDVGRLVGDARTNAILSWILVAAMATTVVGTALAGHLLWASFAAAVLVIVLLPPIALRNPRSMLPWEVLVLAGLPVLARSVLPFPSGGRIATYLSVAALALVVAVELHLFTTVRMNAGFAVLFVVIATMAVAGIWAVVRWVSDLWLGTAFLLDDSLSEHAIERGLMLEFVASTIAGILAGAVFEFYVRRRAKLDPRLPRENRR